MTGCVDAYCVSRRVKFKQLHLPNMNPFFTYIVLCYLHMYGLYAMKVFLYVRYTVCSNYGDHVLHYTVST